MQTTRDIRRMAFQAMFQLDAVDEPDLDALRAGLAQSDRPDGKPVTPESVEQAIELAQAAFRERRHADDAVRVLAPTWPAHRQPAVDRAILRVAHYEMTHADSNPKVVVNDAIEIAKAFSTEQSPAFINGVLDKVLKQVLAERQARTPATPEPASPANTQD